MDIMKCIFIKNGIAIGNKGVVKPCCIFSPSEDYSKKFTVSTTNFDQWRSSSEIQQIEESLANNIWPIECAGCQRVEEQSRGDSMRLNGESAYSHYSDEDITLEMRPGTVCNFACQTCWPHASSKVRGYYKRAGLEIPEIPTEIVNYESLNSIIHRVKDVVILGGEPFYDKQCLEFLSYLSAACVQANITIFTNGSVIKFDVLEKLKQVTLVFSIDAVGRPAEYIRFGSDWSLIEKNFFKAKMLKNVKVRCNVTTSIYNYLYLNDLMRWLTNDWPEVVSFGVGNSSYIGKLDESVIPNSKRPQVIAQLSEAIDFIKCSKLDTMQKSNTINTLTSIIQNLNNKPFLESERNKLVNYIRLMDSVKNAHVNDYCPELCEILDISL